MPHTRSKLREKIMVILYQIALYEQNNIKYDIDTVIKENTDMESEFIKEMVYGVITHEDSIINEVNNHLKDWSIERLDKTGAAIMKMGIYEIKYTDTPQVVAINEAVELAKKFSDDAVRKMVNAVLDKVGKNG